MLIKRLIIRSTLPTTEVIRDIEFNLSGLNLIVDNTKEVSEDSGNNVGKSTAIKIIDLCLGGKSTRSIYYDDDTKSENSVIKEFISKNKVEAELVLVKDKNEDRQFSIVRQLYPRGKKIINGKVCDNKEEYESILKEEIFNLKDDYPTLRQLIPKFVRTNDTTTDNMIKYLPGSPSNDTYDTVYLFLFRILQNSLLSQRDILSNNLRECEKKIKLFEQDDNISSLNSLKQREKLIETELDNLNFKRKNLSYMDEYKEELKKKRELTISLERIEQKIEIIELDINCMNDTIAQLSEQKSNINVSQIKDIYMEAKVYINNLNKTFDDVVKFHNKMIENRIKFIMDKFNKKNEELSYKIQERDKLLEQKKQLTLDAIDEGLLDELNVLNTKIEKLNIEKGEIKQSIKILEGTGREKEEILKGIREIDEGLNSDKINEKIKAFNTYFSSYCEQLYGEKYLFVYNNEWKQSKKFPVSIDSFKGNVGTGMKKGIIVAFDLAYISYANEMKIDAPKFVIHDRLENTHINQLKTIFKLSEKIQGQYIIPILRERIDKIDNSLIEQAKILEMSTEDKFFRV